MPTWHEETVYKVDPPGNRLEHWAKIESERFANPVFRLFHTELETVYEEKNRSIDNKDRLLQREVNNAFHAHPYGQQPTLGTIEHLKNPSIKAIEEFYAKHHAPQNMAICISGDIDPDKAFALIEKHFHLGKTQDLFPEPKWAEGPWGREFIQVQDLVKNNCSLSDGLAITRTSRSPSHGYGSGQFGCRSDQPEPRGGKRLEQRVLSQNYNDHESIFLWNSQRRTNLGRCRKAILAEIDKIRKGEFED